MCRNNARTQPCEDINFSYFMKKCKNITLFDLKFFFKEQKLCFLTNCKVSSKMQVQLLEFKFQYRSDLNY